MESNSFDGAELSDTSSENTIDKAGNKVKKNFSNDEERKQARQRKVIHKMKTNIGYFFKENTLGDILPNNQKLVVLNHELTIAQAIDAMVRQQNIDTAVIWNK